MSLVLVKLGMSAFFGLIIGIERELKNKPVGLKTSLVISISSCLLTIVSIESARQFSLLSGQTVMDPMRLAAQIVSGIGFLGAGVILRRSNDVISGLTTAAMIWGASGLGIAAGAGFYKEAAAGAFLILISVELIPLIMKWIGPKALRQIDIKLKLVVNPDTIMSDVMKEINELKVKIVNVRIKDLENDYKKMEMAASIYEKRYTTDLYDDVKKIDGIRSVEIETLG
ncbi:putative Mg2+ transporter-C (MgtC) family protein [Fictibacillus halophilus]|uniref:Mg2+ transporter-C (MgtC) family protein n=1 Tax=Fictibacillus halophilus TaxID=1610490 RepID=A0ABV2LIZ2_9BACL|nr:MULTISPECIES: MgtC/SapB family protein [Fictibacillus]MBH0156080.1 MgtC/SapB family protein [Fictibacillus sp. 5RED26]MBH0160808.1 MgtC/SapB family protein [Fictibacillus sp. 26RED30]MBH0165700.1 MgtC/SapB family protein [Fictibacillus sp. 7GRE50]MBH0173251.1 MgtC/SapB family protein [Fictibacillus sp. 23RED33]